MHSNSHVVFAHILQLSYAVCCCYTFLSQHTMKRAITSSWKKAGEIIQSLGTPAVGPPTILGAKLTVYLCSLLLQSSICAYVTNQLQKERRRNSEGDERMSVYTCEEAKKEEEEEEDTHLCLRCRSQMYQYFTNSVSFPPPIWTTSSCFWTKQMNENSNSLCEAHTDPLKGG